MAGTSGADGSDHRGRGVKAIHPDTQTPRHPQRSAELLDLRLPGPVEGRGQEGREKGRVSRFDQEGAKRRRNSVS